MNNRLHRKVSRETITVRGREAVPIDRQAAIVTSPGITYTPDKRQGEPVWQAPLPTIPHPDKTADLTGTRRGRLVLIGYLGSARYLARCDCGNYVRRASGPWRKAITDPDDTGDACDLCRHVAYVKRRDEYLRHGRNSSDVLNLR